MFWQQEALDGGFSLAVERSSSSNTEVGMVIAATVVVVSWDMLEALCAQS